jgi:hypothetical protein
MCFSIDQALRFRSPRILDRTGALAAGLSTSWARRIGGLAEYEVAAAATGKVGRARLQDHHVPCPL